MVEFPLLGDPQTAAGLPELPWRVIPAEEIEAALAAIEALMRTPVEPAEADRG